MKKVVTFGEMMLRLKPLDHQRILQTSQFEAVYGGAEANVAISLALLGDQAAFMTKFPDNLLGQTALSNLRKYNVNTDQIIYGGPRLGVYYFEKGASVRNTNVVYDRAGSSFALSEATEYDWPEILKDTDYFYFSGITPAISDQLFQAVLAACQYCHENGVTIICDMNYRGKMWSQEKAQAAMGQLMHYVNICIANDEDFEETLGIRAFDGDMTRGIDQRHDFEAAMREVTKRYPNCTIVASVLRNIYSVEKSQWTGLLLRDGKFYEAPVYDMHVMEGVAGGDAFSGGLIHSLVHDFPAQEMINYATAASVLKLTISGDQNLVSDSDIRSVMNAANGASSSVDR